MDLTADDERPTRCSLCSVELDSFPIICGACDTEGDGERNVVCSACASIDDDEETPICQECVKARARERGRQEALDEVAAGGADLGDNTSDSEA